MVFDPDLTPMVACDPDLRLVVRPLIRLRRHAARLPDP